MADIDLQIIASHQATRDTRQTAQRSPVPHVDRDPGSGTPPRHESPAYTATKPVAFDVLLAAQLARAPEKVRAFDVRGAYGDKSQANEPHANGAQANGFLANRSQTGRNQDAPASPGVFVEQSSPQSAAPPAPNAPSWPDNVIPLFISAEDETSSAPSPSQDGLSQIASRAYVNAGAFDGRAFATAGLDGRLHADAQGFDFLI